MIVYNINNRNAILETFKGKFENGLFIYQVTKKGTIFGKENKHMAIPEEYHIESKKEKIAYVHWNGKEYVPVFVSSANVAPSNTVSIHDILKENELAEMAEELQGSKPSDNTHIIIMGILAFVCIVMGLFAYLTLGKVNGLITASQAPENTSIKALSAVCLPLGNLIDQEIANNDISFTNIKGINLSKVS